MFSLPRDDRSSVADWVELELALDPTRNSISKAVVSAVLEQEMGANADEAFLSDVWRLLERREELYRNPPFEVNDDLVARRNDVAVHDVYVACLLFSLYGVRTSRTDPQLLERIAAICIEKYLHGTSFVFGWPPLDGIPKKIGERLALLASSMRERLADYPQDKYKDRGVDVVSWKAFVDEDYGQHRSGQVAILTQCAAGQDWASKKGDVPIDAWKQYIHWASPPIRGFVVPGVVQDENWHDMSVDCGLIFDRARLCNNLPDPFPDADLLTSMHNWIEEEKAEATG
ncbi:MAG: hypothetical protein NDI91_14430 [Sulfuritalea sp.]|nr:hypothetical protein [Sulfuritalea sp.]